MKNKFQKDWQRFAHSFYRQKGSVYQDATDEFTVTEKKETKQVLFDDFQYWYNALYDKLLRGDNILTDFANWSRRQYENKKSFKIFHIVKIYQKYFSEMNEKTLEKIEEIADFVIADQDKIKKRLTKLRNSKHEGDVRAFLLDLIEAKKEGEPLVRLRDYTTYLFPDGTFGAVIRDLLLISIYEKLRDKQLFVELENESNS